MSGTLSLLSPLVGAAEAMPPLRLQAGLRRTVARLADRFRQAIYRRRDEQARGRVRHLVHVGAHNGRGYPGLLSGLRNTEVHLFEANPRLAAGLRERLAGHDNLKVYEAALSDQAGEAEFHISEDSRGSSLFGSKRNLVSPQAIKVKTMATGAFLDSLEGDLALYLNCEGGEFHIVPQVLEGERWRRVALCHVDWHDQPWRLPEMAAEAGRLRRELAAQGVRQVGAEYFFWILAG